MKRENTNLSRSDNLELSKQVSIEVLQDFSPEEVVLVDPTVHSAEIAPVGVGSGDGVPVVVLL